MSLAMAPLPIPMGIGGLAGKIICVLHEIERCTIALRFFCFSFFQPLSK